jgi:LuxR family transcriptional regulator, maltose regulon positive regulatory protein
MNHPLSTKCYIPPWRPNGVSRTRLVNRLQSGFLAGRKLTLIAAPAGYGKTTLVAEWVQSQAPAVAWLALDEHDNEVGRFLRYLLLALQQMHADAGRHLQADLAAPQLPSPAALAASLLADLAVAGQQVTGEVTGAGPGRILLAFDDYHKIRTPLIHDLVQQLLDHLPPECHLLLISREDPPLALPRLRVRGELTEIRAEDLRFTEAEAAQFFNQAMQLALPAGAVAALEARTEGWIASLHLAALSLQGRNAAQVDAFIHAFGGSHRYVFDYLAEEVLGQQDAEIGLFLRQTAVLDRFSAPLCQAVTGRTDSQAILQQLEQANLFLVPLDDARIWYRYHHLFADYLRMGLPPDESARLQASASQWCETNGLLFEAVHYALAGGSQELAADVVERVIQNAATWSGGELATLVGWIDALPGQLLRVRPRLSLHASRALFLSGRLVLSEQFIDQAEQVLRTQQAAGQDTTGLLAVATVYRAAIAALRGEVRTAIALGTAALAHLPETDLHARARAADGLGLAYGLLGDLALAEQFYTQASGLAQAAGVVYLAINARCEVAQVQIAQGRLQAAAQSCRRALELAGDTRIPPLGLAWAILGAVAYEQNDLAAAERYLQEGMALSQQGGLTDDLRSELLLLARLKRATGDLPAAAVAVAQGAAIVQRYQAPRLAQIAAACQAQIHLACGEMAAAQRWADAYALQRQAGPAEANPDFEELTLVRILLATGELAQALAIVIPLQQQAEAAGRLRTSIEALALQALIQAAAQERAAAVASLAKALRQAEPEGFLRPFLDEGAPLADLLPAARYAAPALVRRLLAALPDEEHDANVAPTAVDALSEQETIVLRLLCAGRSNQQIADELVISVGTAKWHVHNILQKLGVSSRAQATLRARDLGLAPL